MVDKKGFVIAIDGPVASGKGTIAASLAKDLQGFYLYTGATYRAVALFCIQKRIVLESERDVESALSAIKIQFENAKILLNGKDVTERLKEPDAASGASVVGVYKKVREAMVTVQQKTAQEAITAGKIVVAEGRDMGTTVFPDAALKVYLTARAEVRARRRMEQFVTEEKDLKKELVELRKRDTRDTERSVSPLPNNPEKLGYIVLDNSDMSEEETLDLVKKELEKKGLMV